MALYYSHDLTAPQLVSVVGEWEGEHLPYAKLRRVALRLGKLIELDAPKAILVNDVRLLVGLALNAGLGPPELVALIPPRSQSCTSKNAGRVGRKSCGPSTPPPASRPRSTPSRSSTAGT